MFRPVRTLISLAFVAGFVWFSFSVKLGDHTLAEHVDRISRTPEAHELLDGTRDTVNPVIEETRDRVLGEVVEAPTRAEPSPGAKVEPAPVAGPEPKVSSPDRAKLPG